MVIIEPYDTEMGVYWRIIHAVTREVLEDGFDSTADAEMYANERYAYGQEHYIRYP